jgi:SEL1 protein
MQGAEKDLDRAEKAYRRAQLQQNSQAMFNLGYMYEHGLGLPKDLHLAKRFYDQALDTEPAAMLPVTFALVGLYLRQHYGESFIVSVLPVPTIHLRLRIG